MHHAEINFNQSNEQLATCTWNESCRLASFIGVELRQTFKNN